MGCVTSDNRLVSLLQIPVQPFPGVLRAERIRRPYDRQNDISPGNSVRETPRSLSPKSVSPAPLRCFGSLSGALIQDNANRSGKFGGSLFFFFFSIGRIWTRMIYRPRLELTGREKVGGVHNGRFSTPSVSPPILGEKRNLDAFIYGLTRAHARFEDARSVRLDLKTRDRSRFPSPRLGRVRVGLTSKNHFLPEHHYCDHEKRFSHTYSGPRG